MTAFKCDICGAYYEPYNYHHNQNAEKPNSIMTYTKRSGLDNTVNMERYDLCPECMKAILEVMEKRKG